MKTIPFAVVACLASVQSYAQNYPAKTIRIVVPYVAGGNTDFTARVIAAKLVEVFGQQIVIENRAGGGTNIGSDLIAKAPADGYSLLMGGASNAINMSLYPKMSYDTLRDFAPVVLCVKGANVLSVHPALPAKTLKELLSLARAQPGKLNFASSGIGSSNQMAGELLKVMAKVNITHVPYKGNPPALIDTVSGQVEMLFSGVPALLPHIQSGRLRALAIGSLKRFPALPTVPTLDEAGLKDYEATTWFGLMAPAKVPKDIVARLNSEIGKALANKEVHDRFINEGVEPMGGTPEQFGMFIRDEIEKYAKVVKAGNLKAE